MPTADEILIRISADTAELRRQLRNAEQQTRSSSNRLRNSFNSANSSVIRLNRSVSDLRRALLAVGVGLSIRQYAELADQWSLLQSRVKIVSSSTGEAKQNFDQLFNIAQRVGVSLESTVQLFQRLAQSQEELGVGAEHILQFTENVQKLVIVSGASAQEANAAIIQLSQGLQSGTLRGDELRSVMEQMPIFARLTSAEMGILVSDFRKLASEGKVTADVILRAILKRTEDIQKRFEQVPETVGRAGTRLRNEFLRLIGFIDSGSQASREMAASIDSIRQTISDPAFQSGVANIVKTLVDGAKFLIENQSILLGILGAMAGAKIGGLPGAAIGGTAGIVSGVLLSDSERKAIEDEIKTLEGQKIKLLRDLESAKKDLSSELFTGFSEERTAQILNLTERINDLKNAIGGLLEVEKERQTTEDILFTGAEGQRKLETPKPKDRDTKEEKDVIANLQFERDQLQLTNREQFQYNALKKAKSDLNSIAGKTIFELAGFLYDETQATNLSTKAQQDRLDELVKANDIHVNVSRSIKNEIADNKLLIAAANEGSKAYREQSVILEVLNQFRSESIDLTDKERMRYEELARTLASQREELKKVEDAQNTNKRAAEDFANVIATAFEDAIIKGEKFRDILKSLLEDIQRIILRVAITEPLQDLIIQGLGIVSGLFTGEGTSGLNQGGTVPAQGSINTGAGGMAFAAGGIMTSRGPLPLRRYQTGGVASSPQLTIFGESSKPEAFVPLPDGRSIPVNLKGDSSNVSVEQIFNLSTGVVPQVRAEILSLLPQIAEATAKVIQSKRFRDPSFIGNRK